MLTHFLALGDLIAEQIKAEMPNAFRLVADAADLKGVKDSTQVAPACHIIFFGAKPGAQLKQSSKVAWDQTWLTVVVTRSAKDPKSGAGARALAGALLSSLLPALSGWKPFQDESVLPLEPAQAPAPPLLTDAGTLYVPIAWRARVAAWS